MPRTRRERERERGRERERERASERAREGGREGVCERECAVLIRKAPPPSDSGQAERQGREAAEAKMQSIISSNAIGPNLI